MKRLAQRARAGVTTLFLLPLLAYRRLISPALPRRCKYEPTCSAYAEEAVRELGILRGSVVAAWRVVRCNPWSHGGYDPVEERTLFRVPAADGADPPTPAPRISGGV